MFVGERLETKTPAFYNRTLIFFLHIFLQKSLLYLCFYGVLSQSKLNHHNPLGKSMNLRPGQPMPCEGNWVVRQGADRTLTNGQGKTTYQSGIFARNLTHINVTNLIFANSSNATKL